MCLFIVWVFFSKNLIWREREELEGRGGAIIWGHIIQNEKKKQFKFKCQWNDQLTVFAFALLDESFVFDVFVAGFTVEPGSKLKTKNQINDETCIIWRYKRNLLTSSADWAIKNPCVLDEILAPRGLMEIFESSPSSDLSSMANKSSLSLVKHNLQIRVISTTFPAKILRI